MFKIRKSQAALEFLTTYAWAFIIILITIAALAYFGVLSPSRLLPDRCNFGPEITCDKNRLIVNDDDGTTLSTVQMRLVNSFGTGVTVTSATVSTDVAAAGTCIVDIVEATGFPGTPYDWSSKSAITFTADCDGGTDLVEKEKIKFDIEISYYPTSEGPVAGPGYTKIIFGEIFTSIQ